MAFDSAKAFGKRFGVAVLAARANLGAAADWVPGRVGPFDLGVEGHCFAHSDGCEVPVCCDNYLIVTTQDRVDDLVVNKLDLVTRIDGKKERTPDNLKALEYVNRELDKVMRERASSHRLTVTRHLRDSKTGLREGCMSVPCPVQQGWMVSPSIATCQFRATELPPHRIMAASLARPGFILAEIVVQPVLESRRWSRSPSYR